MADPPTTPQPSGAAPAEWPSAASSVVGVMGDPVADSLSPLLHNTAFAALGLDWVSVGFEVAPGDAPAAISGARALGLVGLSVTMPHKAAVLPLLEDCTAVARRLGAVNCVTRQGDRLVGDNTDGAGFLASMARGAGFRARGERCLVAGAGGAAWAIVLALADAGAAEVVVVNRTASRAAAAAALAGPVGRVGRAEDAGVMALVVNATPAGMRASAAQGAVPPIDAAAIHRGQVVADLVYHPVMTPFLAAAAASGATVVGGLGMLVHQAALQLARWSGLDPPVEAMWAAGLAAVEARERAES